jgi:hypothetical protein
VVHTSTRNKRGLVVAFREPGAVGGQLGNLPIPVSCPPRARPNELVYALDARAAAAMALGDRFGAPPAGP